MSLALEPKNLAVGQCIVELQKLKKKYGEMEKARQAIRDSLGDIKPGKYDNYMVVPVKEVRVKAHTRCAHNRLLLR
jgi:hypothetical protein